MFSTSMQPPIGYKRKKKKKASISIYLMKFIHAYKFSIFLYGVKFT